MKTSIRLVSAGFTVMLLLLLGMAAAGMQAMTSINDRLRAIVEERNVKIDIMQEMRNAARERSLVLFRMASRGDPFALEDETFNLNRYAADFIRSRDALQAMRLNEEERQAFQDSLELVRKAQSAQQEVVALMQEDRFAEAQVHLLEKAMPVQQELLESYGRILEIQREASQTAMEEARRAYHDYMLLIMGLGLATLVLGGLVAVYVVRRTRATEAELKQEKERAEVTVRSITDAVITTEADGTVNSMNPAAEILTGWFLDQARGRHVREVFPLVGTESGTPIASPVEKVLGRGQAGDEDAADRSIQRADGSRVEVECTAASMHADDGTAIGAVLVARDITESRRAQQRLQDLAMVADRTDNAVVITDAQARVEWVNDGFHRLTGYRLAEVQGKVPGHLLQGPDTDPGTVAYIGRQVRAGEGFMVELINYTKQGQKYWLSINAQPVRDESGKVVKFIAIESNITERKLSEEKLRQLNESLEERVNERTRELVDERVFIETVLDTATGLVVVLDAEGRIVRFNRACEELTGYRLDEVGGTPFWQFLVAPERVEGLRQMLEDMSQSGASARHEGEWLTRSGGRRLIDWTNAPLLGPDGKLRFIVATGSDITERKQAEQGLLQANADLKETIATLTSTRDQLVQAEKMASLGSLVAGISHEINTPLGIGVTSATTLQEEVGQLQKQFGEGSMKRSNLERFFAQAEQGLDILIRNLHRAAELIRSFKQVAVDQSSDQWRRLDLREYVDEILTSLRPRWKHTPIQVGNEVAEGLFIYTHPGALYQIISNLVMNSLSHAYEPDQPGTLRIRAELRGGRLHLEYSDDGKGIPSEFQSRVFDPFFTTRRGSGGSGLGMHIVYNLVTGPLQGSIALASQEGEGTTFRMVFPLLNEENETDEPNGQQ